MPIALTPRSCLRLLLVAGLTALFAFGAVVNLAPPPSVTGDYARWGYPEHFHYLTGAMEALAALLIARKATRLDGALIGGLVMIGAFGTLIAHGELTHALAPTGVLALLILCLHLDDKAREADWEGKLF